MNATPAATATIVPPWAATLALIMYCCIFVSPRMNEKRPYVNAPTVASAPVWKKHNTD